MRGKSPRKRRGERRDNQDPPATIKDVEESVKWLRAYAAEVNHYDEPYAAYERLMEELRSGHSITYQGTDMHSQADLLKADDLRYHAERVLGIRIDFNNFEYFSCTC